jgi:predicted chitinase
MPSNKDTKKKLPEILDKFASNSEKATKQLGEMSSQLSAFVDMLSENVQKESRRKDTEDRRREKARAVRAQRDAADELQKTQNEYAEAVKGLAQLDKDELKKSKQKAKQKESDKLKEQQKERQEKIGKLKEKGTPYSDIANNNFSSGNILGGLFASIFAIKDVSNKRKLSSLEKDEKEYNEQEEDRNNQEKEDQEKETESDLKQKRLEAKKKLQESVTKLQGSVQPAASVSPSKIVNPEDQVIAETVKLNDEDKVKQSQEQTKKLGTLDDNISRIWTDHLQVTVADISDPAIDKLKKAIGGGAPAAGGALSSIAEIAAGAAGIGSKALNIGKQLIKGGGGLAIGGLAAEYGGNILKEQGYDKVGGGVSALGKIATDAGTGAMIGSVIPGIGTTVGGAIGAVYGVVSDWDEVSKALVDSVGVIKDQVDKLPSNEVISKQITDTGKNLIETSKEIITSTPTKLVAAKGRVSASIDLIGSELQKRGMTPAQIAAVLGNVSKESGFIPKSENLNYSKTSNERIKTIFGSRATGKSDAELNSIKQDPTKMGEFMYGANTKIGQSMGNIEPGDGFKYRGRGFIQLTGKNNYAAASKDIFGDDRLVKNPDMANDPSVAAQITAWFMSNQGTRMAKKMGVDLLNSSQDTLNRVYTSAVAGHVIKADDKGYLGGEVMSKVRAAASQFLPSATPPQQLASTPQTGVNVVAAMKNKAETDRGNTVTIAPITTNNLVSGAKSGDGLPYRDARDYIRKAVNPDVFGIVTRSSAG